MTEIYFDDYKMSDFVFARLKLNTAFTNINIKYYKRGIFTTYSKMRSRVKAIFYNYGVFDYLRFAMSGFIKGDNRQQATLFQSISTIIFQKKIQQVQLLTTIELSCTTYQCKPSRYWESMN